MTVNCVSAMYIIIETYCDGMRAVPTVAVCGASMRPVGLLCSTGVPSSSAHHCSRISNM